MQSNIDASMNRRNNRLDPQSNIAKINETIISDSERTVPDFYKVNIEKNIENQEKVLDEYTRTISKNDIRMEIGEVIKNIDQKIKNCSIAQNNLIKLYKRLKINEVSYLSPTIYTFYNPDPENLMKLPNEIEKYQRIANLAKYIIDNNFIFPPQNSNKTEPMNFLPPNFDNSQEYVANYKSFAYWQIFIYLCKQFEMPFINLELFSNAELVYKYEITTLFITPRPPGAMPGVPGAPATPGATSNMTGRPAAPPPSTSNIMSGGQFENTNRMNRSPNVHAPPITATATKNGEKKDEPTVKRYMTKDEYVEMLKKIQFQHEGKYENLYKYTNDYIKEYVETTFSKFLNPYNTETDDDAKKPILYNKNENKLKQRLIYKLKDDKTRENRFVYNSAMTKLERKPIRILKSVFDIFNKEIEYRFEDLARMLGEPNQRERIFSKVKPLFNELKKYIVYLLGVDKDFRNGISRTECVLVEYGTGRKLTSTLTGYSPIQLRDIAEKIEVGDTTIRYEGTQIEDSEDDVNIVKCIFEIANMVIAGYFANPNKKLDTLFSTKVEGKEKEKVFIGMEEIFNKFKPKPELIQYELINMYLKKYDLLFVNFLHTFRYKGGKELFDGIRERVYKFLIGYYHVYQDRLIEYIIRLSTKYELPVPSFNYQKNFGTAATVRLRNKEHMKISEMLAALPERYTEQIREMERNVIAKHPVDSNERRELVKKMEELVVKTYENYLKEMKPVAEYQPETGVEVSENAAAAANTSVKNKNLNKKLRNAVFSNQNE